MTVTVEDHPEHGRFEARDEAGVVAGFLQYRRHDDRLWLVHTEVDDAFEGQGVGSTLVGGVLDQAREAGLRVVPLCPFVQAYLERHPEYAPVVEQPAR